MFKNILSKNNMNIWKNIIIGNTNVLNKIAFLSKQANLSLNIIQSFRYSEVYSQNISRGKYNQRKNKGEFSRENRYNQNSDNNNSDNAFESINKRSYYNRDSDRTINKSFKKYDSKGRTIKNFTRENDSIIHTNKTIDITNEHQSQYKSSGEAKKDSAIARKIIENPNVQMKISEDDLHAALAKTAELPEDFLKRLIEQLKINCEEQAAENSNSNSNFNNLPKAENKIFTNFNNSINNNSSLKKKENLLNFSISENKKFLADFEKEVQFSITKKFKVFLNKSLVNIAKTAKRNSDLFKNNKSFWLGLEQEVMERCDSLTNEQITDIVTAFAKAEVPEIKLLDEIEDLIIETTVPFSPEQLERIFNSYSSQHKGTTSFLKNLTRKYMKHTDILDSWRLVKFITDLHNHPHTIKGDFGHVKELEAVISKDIENRKVRFENLVQIANCIFTHNLCSNKIQLLVENELIDKISDFNRVDFDVAKFIKLIKSLNGYYVKNEELCDRIKNVLETYLTAYMKLQQESFYEGEKRGKSKNKINHENEVDDFNKNKNYNDNNYKKNVTNQERFEFEKAEEDVELANEENKIGRRTKVSKQLYKNTSATAADFNEIYEEDKNNENSNKRLNKFNNEITNNFNFHESNQNDNDFNSDKYNHNDNYNQRKNSFQNQKQSKNETNYKSEEQQSDSEPDLIIEQIDPSELESLNSKTQQKKNRTINYEFMERYNKIITNISVIFWSLSKNEKFKSLKNTREDYKYFFESMKEMTLKNLEFYNEREVTFILKAFRDLEIPLTNSQNKNFIKKISALENFTLHDRIVLLGLFLKNDMGGSLELILKFIDKVKQSFNSLTYSDLIEFLELLNSVPNLFGKIVKENNNEKIAFIEKRFTPILNSIEIEKFCKLFLIAGNFQVLFSESFLKILNKNLLSRINEIQKEYFCSVMQHTVNLSGNNAAAKLLDILEDLSHFENIKENFVKFEDLNNLLWACLSFSKVQVNQMLEENGENEGLLNAALALKLNNFSKSLVASLIGIDNIFKFEEAGKIKLLLDNNNNNKNDSGNAKGVDNENKELKEQIEDNQNLNKQLIKEIANKNENGNIEEILASAYKNLNAKLLLFIEQSFNLDAFAKEFESNSKNKSFLTDKSTTVVLYFQTIQLILQFAKNNFYYNLSAENLFVNNPEISSILLNNINHNNKKTTVKNKTKQITEELNQKINKILSENFIELKESILPSLSENSIKSDVSILDNFVLTDAASQNDKGFAQDVLQNVDLFFAKKPNCSIYQNLIDDYFNAINVSVVFEIPQLGENEFVSGIDANKYAVVFLNGNYFSGLKKENNNNVSNNYNNSSMLKFYENRISLLSELFEWKVILVTKSFWNSEEFNKQEFLKEKIGFDMQDEENIKIKVLDRNQINQNKNNSKDNTLSSEDVESKINADKKPKYNLTKQIINKKHIKKN